MITNFWGVIGGHGGCMFFLCSSCAKEFEGKKQDGEQVLLKYDQTPPPTSSEMVLEIEAEDDVEAKAITTPKTPAPTETKQTAPEPSVLDDPKLKVLKPTIFSKPIFTCNSLSCSWFGIVSLRQGRAPLHWQTGC